MSDYNPEFMLRAIQLAKEGSASGNGGPFGAVIVRGDKIVGEGNNRVTLTNDPSAHAEIVAIRNACETINDFQLTGCTIYTSCEPCPMCLGAIYWARPDRVFFAATKADAANAGFDDAFIYDEIVLDPEKRKIPMFSKPTKAALDLFEAWKTNPNKIDY